MPNEKISILIVEDNLDLCAIYKIAFEAAGFTLRISTSAMDGIVKSLETKPDVILLDIMMPDMDGFEVLQALRTNSSMEVLIIINSNIRQQNDIDRAMKLGANAYLQKSNYSPSELVQKVREITDTHENVGVSSETPTTEDNILSMFFPQEFLHIFAVQHVNNEQTGSVIMLEETNIPPQWNGNNTSIGGYLPSETITGLLFGKKTVTLIVQRHIWQVEGGSTTVKRDISIEKNAIVLSIKEITS